MNNTSSDSETSYSQDLHTSESDSQKPNDWIALFQDELTIFSLIFGSSVALHALNVFVVTTIMPSVVNEIGGLDVYSWSSTAFIIASILSAVFTSRLLAKVGANKTYAFAAIIFTTGCLMCALAPNIWTLIFGRTMQGFGGGFFYTLAYAIIRMVYPNRLWPVAIGLITVMWGVATLIGPAVGGIFAELGSWRIAFWILIPFVSMVGIMAYIVMPLKKNTETKVEGLPLSQITLLVTIILVVSIGSINTSILKVIGSLTFSLLLGLLLIHIEKNAKERLLPLGAFSWKDTLGAHYICIALLLFSMQPEIFIPYLLQILHNQSPLWAGYIGAFMALGWTMGSVISASWTGELAAKTVFIGPIFGLLGLLLQVIFLPIQSNGAWIILAPISLGLVFVGFGIGIAWPHIVTRIYERAPRPEQDLAAAGVTTVQLFATALGAALSGIVVNLAGINNTDSVEGASSAALWLCLLFALFPLSGVFIARKAR